MNLGGRRVVLVLIVILVAALLTGWYFIQTRSPQEEPRDARLVCPLVSGADPYALV